MGLKASVVKSPVAVEKLIQAFIPSTDKKIVEKIELNEVATQFYHAFSKINKCLLFYSTPALSLFCY